MKDGGTRKQWYLLGKANEAIKAAIAKGDMAKFADRLKRLESIITEGNNQFDAWDGVVKAVKDFVQIQANEQKWEKDKYDMMTAEDAKTLFGAMAAAVAEIVVDKRARELIFARFSALAGDAPGRAGELAMLPEDEDRARWRAVNRKLRREKKEERERVEEEGKAKDGDEGGELDT